MLRYAALAVGVLIVSTAALLIRFATGAGAGSLAVAAGRLTVAAAVVVPLAFWLRRREIGRLSRSDCGTAAVAGLFLALHFASWIASLAFTSVASSVALVTTNPIWVGLASWLLLKAAPVPRVIVGIALSIGGSLLILLSDASAGDAATAAVAAPAPVLGNALALGGAIAMSAYLLAGARLNRKITLLSYVAIVYAAAAVLLNLMAAAAGEALTTVPPAAWLPIVLLALGAKHGLMPGADVLTGPGFVTQENAEQVIELSAKGIR